jgi:glucose-6-phosphate dehydrogenase assembly protein OpcA
VIADAVDVPFSKIAETMARGACRDAGATPMRALLATMVAVGPADRLRGAAGALQALADAGTVRGMIISEGDNPAPSAQVAGNTVALHGLKTHYINNAVAALRLSSLPTLVWWRGGRPDTLDGLANLADRVVLDEENPERIWARAAALFDRSAFSDVRWARLTQWRALMAHFFDVPEVQAVSADFNELAVRARDPFSARLFAAWLTSSIRFDHELKLQIAQAAKEPIEEIRLTNHGQELVLRLGGARCIETAVSVHGHQRMSRVVSLHDASDAGVLTEELRIRARDLAFERTVHALVNGRQSSGEGTS